MFVGVFLRALRFIYNFSRASLYIIYSTSTPVAEAAASSGVSACWDDIAFCYTHQV